MVGRDLQVIDFYGFYGVLVTQDATKKRLQKLLETHSITPRL